MLNIKFKFFCLQKYFVVLLPLSFCQNQSTTINGWAFDQSCKCVLSPRKWYGDRPLQKSHFILTLSLGDPSRPGWVKSLDWHGQHDPDLHQLKRLSLIPSRTITGAHSCYPAKCCCMDPIQTGNSWKYGKLPEQKGDGPTTEYFWPKTCCWFKSKWPFGGTDCHCAERGRDFTSWNHLAWL